MSSPAIPPRPLQRAALFIAALCAAAPAFAQAPPCPAVYQDSYKSQWAIAHDDWSKLCAQTGDSGSALREGQRTFVEKCKTDATLSILANLVSSDDVDAFCAQGVPGRVKIPRAPTATLPANTSATQIGNAAAVESPALIAAQSRTLERTSGDLTSTAANIRTAIAGNVGTLYGDNTGTNVANMLGGAGSDGATAKPPIDPSSISAPKAPEPGLPPAAGLKSKAVPPPPYNPADKNKAPLLITLDERLETNGVSAEAIAYVRERYHNVLEHLNVGTLQNLVTNDQYLSIIPKDKKLTDVAPFTSLKGQKTFDGRAWEDVRGVNGVSMGAGTPGQATAIGEENFLEGGGGYPEGFVFFHEYGHAVMRSGLPPKAPPPTGWVDKLKRKVWGDPASQEEIKEIYDASMKRPQKTDLGAYADSNDDEFYAQAAAAYFGAGYRYYKTPEDKTANKAFQETPVTLKHANPDIYKVCESVYGKPGRYWNKK